MVNARPGYWDVDQCAWVGVEPTESVPVIHGRDHAPVRVPSETSLDVPSPRDARTGDGAAPSS